MRSSFATTKGGPLARTPNHRQQAARRRLMALCAMLGLALASGLIGSLTAGTSEPTDVRTGPFSYFPSQ